MVEPKYNVEDNFQAAVSILQSLIKEDDDTVNEIINIVGEQDIIDGLLALNMALLSRLQNFLPESETLEDTFAAIRNSKSK